MRHHTPERPSGQDGWTGTDRCSRGERGTRRCTFGSKGAVVCQSFASFFVFAPLLALGTRVGLATHPEMGVSWLSVARTTVSVMVDRLASVNSPHTPGCQHPARRRRTISPATRRQPTTCFAPRLQSGRWRRCEYETQSPAGEAGARRNAVGGFFPSLSTSRPAHPSAPIDHPACSNGPPMLHTSDAPYESRRLASGC